MKRKRLTVALSITALLVWGAVFWRVFWKSRTPVAATPELSAGPPSLASEVPAREDTLLLSYRDPFLGAPLMQQPTHVQRNRQPQPPPMASPTAAPIPPWPEVRYQGMVRGVKNGKTTALVRIAGKEHLVSKGDRPSDLLVVLFNSDSLVLERDRKERRTFKAK